MKITSLKAPKSNPFIFNHQLKYGINCFKKMYHYKEDAHVLITERKEKFILIKKIM